MTTDDILELLRRMDSGELDFWIEGRGWNDVYAGDVHFRSAEGHLVVVFNDCDDWDYISEIYEPNGTLVWEFTGDSADDITYWRSTNETRWTAARTIPKGAEPMNLRDIRQGHWYWCWPYEHSTPEVVLVLGSAEPLWVKLLNGETMLVVDVHYWGLRVHEPDTLRDVPIRLLERIRDTADAIRHSAFSVAIAAATRMLERVTRPTSEDP